LQVSVGVAPAHTDRYGRLAVDLLEGTMKIPDDNDTEAAAARLAAIRTREDAVLDGGTISAQAEAQWAATTDDAPVDPRAAGRAERAARRRETWVGSLGRVTDQNTERAVDQSEGSEPAERLAAKVHRRALQALGSDEKAARWLAKPIRELDGVTPGDLARTPEGAEAVIAILGRIEHGVIG